MLKKIDAKLIYHNLAHYAEVPTSNFQTVLQLTLQILYVNPDF